MSRRSNSKSIKSIDITSLPKMRGLRSEGKEERRLEKSPSTMSILSSV
jgi:hypothetical protein